VIAASVPAGTFLAGLAPWAAQSRPSFWLYGLSAGWTAALAGLAFAVGRWRRDPLTPAWLICLITLCVLGVDVMSGSRLQLETPFGLSLLEAGRYYGIGNNALGVYCVSALAAAAAVGGPGGLSPRRGGMGGAQPPMSRGGLGGIVPPRQALGGIVPPGIIAIFAVVASGWPGFGAKVGGTIAMVPCFVLLFLALTGVRPRWRYAVPAALSGLMLVAVFALVSYLVPAAGVSDIGAFAGNLLHGHGGALLERKASSNLGTLTVSALSPLVPIGVVLTGLALWRPSWFRLRTLPLAFEFSPLLRVTVWLVWLVLVLGWFADDSGVIVPAAAAPFTVPLVIAIASSVSSARGATGYRSKTFVGSSVAGQPVKLCFELGRHAVQYQLSRLTAGPVLYSFALGRPKVTGQEYVPETGPAILASNHLSVVDSFYLPLMIPRPVVFPAKAEYFAPKNLVGHLFAAYLKSTNQLRIDRGGARSAYATLDAAVEILRRGDLFGFYPEGTRSPDGRLYRGRPGIGYLTLQSGAPVLPVAMVGTRKMLPPGKWLPRPTRIEIRIGKPMDFGHLAGDPPGKARRLIAEQVTAAIGELSGQEYVHEYASDVKDRLAAGKDDAAKN
jgi:1-acyl-sn-glycerol-3-phosphate acyltransferase